MGTLIHATGKRPDHTYRVYGVWGERAFPEIRSKADLYALLRRELAMPATADRTEVVMALLDRDWDEARQQWVDDFRSQLKQARSEARLSQAELAERAGLSVQAVAAYEQGASSPTWGVVRKLSRTLGKQFTVTSPEEIPEDTPAHASTTIQGGATMSAAPAPIRPDYKTLWELLQGRLFRVPEYQRAYSWQQRQRYDLFEDIRKLFRVPGDQRHHFMATVVFLGTNEKKDIGTDEFRYYDVVDGQQRLTTLILLLKAFSKRLSEGSEQEQAEGKAIQQLLVKGDDQLILLQSNHDSATLFATYLRNGTVPDDEEVKTHADANICAAIRECEEFVAEEKNLLRLLKAIKLRLGFVFFDLNEESVVYTAFEVLNSRGLDVESLDKCKSMLMGQVFESSKKTTATRCIGELHEVWRDVYRTIGRTSLSSSEILRFAATLKAEEAPRRPLSDSDALSLFRSLSQADVGQPRELSTWLLNVTKKVVGLQKNRRLEAVSDISQARLLAVALMLSPSLKAPQRDLALRQWEMVTFRIFGLAWDDARMEVGNYTRLAHAVINDKLTAEQIMDRLRSLGEGYPIADVVQQLQRRNCYEGWEEQLRYFLYRYEEHLAEQAGVNLNDDVWNQIWSVSASRTIEHVYPQSAGDEWPDKLDDPSAVHWLGNLLLLPPDINRRASNHSFAEKKRLYDENRLRMMDEVLQRRKWTQKFIEERGKSLLAFAESAWADIEN